jgi:hypothetical protein
MSKKAAATKGADPGSDDDDDDVNAKNNLLKVSPLKPEPRNLDPASSARC